MNPLPFVDAALPSLAALFDADATRELVARSLPGDVPAPPVRHRYLRYKPGTNAVVHLQAHLGGRWRHVTAMVAAGNHLSRRAAKPENVRLAGRVATRTAPAAPLRFDHAFGALVQWFPLDLKLPALATSPGELGRAAFGGAPRGDPEVLVYNPRRRAVLRIDGHVVKVYADRDHVDAAVRGAEAGGTAAGVRTPPVVGVSHGLNLFAQAFVPGERPADGREVAEPAGALLARLHRGDPGSLAPFGPRRQLEAARASGELVATVLPATADRVGHLLADLERLLPPATPGVLAHGDFSHDQLLVAGEELTVVDFDGACAAPPALDIGTYGAYVVRSGRSLEVAAEAVERLLAGYGARPSGVAWYLATAILRKAPVPFRRFHSGWAEGVEGMVAAAEKALVG